ncbi:MAG TPA: tetratricopeptide repeat protein [Blastocatellia bacterium]|nr:tetratricopeptide repeat protein [Blastocatellia bacterium]
MKRGFLIILLIAFSGPMTVAGQRGGGHTLFGDFKIDESRISGPKPETFHMVLYAANGHPISRQMITNNGRYRFFDLPNGEYYIAIELEAQEITRLHVRLAEAQKTDIRRDIFLEWRPDETGRAKADGSAVVSAADLYDRTPANKALFEKALAAIKAKDYSQAISLLRQVVETDPKDFIAWTELGTVYFRQGNLGEAGSAYKSALQHQPSFALALLNYGKLRMAKKDYEGAIETLDKAVKAHPLSADANYFLGESYLQVKKGSKAVGYLYEALKLDPVGKAEAHLRLALLFNGAGLKDRAVAEYEQFLAKRPDHPDREKIQQYIKQNKKQ